jgi:predicted acylesterase/phospholipase RssA
MITTTEIDLEEEFRRIDNELDLMEKEIIEYTKTISLDCLSEEEIMKMQSLREKRRDAIKRKRFLEDEKERKIWFRLESVFGPNEVRILCLDGGGTRGVVLIELLRHLRDQLGENFLDHFDMVCGTSTGGIIALGLAFGKKIEEIEKFYDELSSKIFPASIVNWGRYLYSAGEHYYDAIPLEKYLKDTFGNELTLSQIKKKCFVVAAEVSQTEIMPYLLRTYDTPVLHDSRNTVGNFYVPATTRDCKNMPVWSACRATSAAPTYFSPYAYKDPVNSKSFLFIDGGIVANNPMELALQECFALYPDAKLRCIVSLGTGLPAIGYLSETKTVLYWKSIQKLSTRGVTGWDMLLG